LAITLACLAGVMAIILFLIEKTPRTIICLLLAMIGLLVYPVLHFFKSRISRAIGFAGCTLGTLLFGWSVWPHNHSISANAGHAQELAQQPSSQPPKDENKPGEKKTTPKDTVKPKPKPVSPQPITTGPISTGPCSNVQVGGSNNQATVNCASPSRVLSADNLQKFKAALVGRTGGIASVRKAGSSDDVDPLVEQLTEALIAAGWGGVYYGTIRVDHKELLAEGIECYSANWDLPESVTIKKAMESAGLRCKYFDKPYSLGGAQFGGITILVGRR
jgi:hypothetical protein